jgi:hypothetical protein
VYLISRLVWHLEKKNIMLKLRFYGPYKIKQMIGLVAYKLCLPKRYIIHSIFHLSLLKEKGVE